MKLGVDLFCASPASTAICSSTDHRSMVRSHRDRGRTPPTHHHHPHPHRHNHPKTFYAPTCSSQLPIIPKPSGNHDHHQKGGSSRKSSADSKQGDVRRKSSADITDLSRSSSSSSTRYLLSDRPFIDWMSSESDHDHHRRRRQATTSSTLVRSQSAKPGPATSLSSSMDGHHHSLSLVNSSSTNNNSSRGDKVVVLRVSIHCKGCEGKVRKHLSKMEGVTSFSIDLATKKVTIIGDVTPLGVLASVSRVKSAQLWPSSSPSPSPSPSSPVINVIGY